MLFLIDSSKESSQRVCWSHKNVEYFGTPFLVDGNVLKQCIVGPNYYHKNASKIEHVSNKYLIEPYLMRNIISMNTHI